jgi:hypothetical protein
MLSILCLVIAEIATANLMGVALAYLGGLIMRRRREVEHDPY